MNTTAASHTTVWLDKICKANSAEELRNFMQQQYPALTAEKLKSIAILGAADEGQRLYQLCQNLNIQVVAMVDDHPARQGLKFGNLSVKPVATLSDVSRDIPVIAATHRFLKSIQIVKQLGFSTVAPFATLQALQPERFPEHMFYERWFETLFNHKKELTRLANMLADDLSKQTLEAILSFRLTLNPEVLEPIIDWNVYAPKNIFAFKDNEIYVDGGTFDGDTIRMFIDRVHGKFDYIYGFEPDTNTFGKLCENFADDSRIKPINKGLYSHDTTLYFDNAGTRASIFNPDAAEGISLPVTSLDKVMNGNRVTYIKMNIEGAEIPALNGAKETIQKWSPKLGISIYHRPQDLWEIPFLIRELNPAYKLYLRQQDLGVIEGVIYAVV